MAITKKQNRRFWSNQAIVCVSDKTTLTFGKTYQIHSMAQTKGKQIVFFLKGKGDKHAYHSAMFVTKLEWLEIEQQVYELFYNN
jgi:outer membrane receptor for ferric coprogen and ferric-rhodotorulic acid